MNVSPDGRGPKRVRHTVRSRCCGFDSSFWQQLPHNNLRCCPCTPLTPLPPPYLPLPYLSSLPRPVILFRFKELHWLQTAAPLPETLLSNIAPLTLCVPPLNRNPANPTSNGVYWERYQTRPLGLDLWPSCRREKGRIQHHLLHTHANANTQQLFFTSSEPAVKWGRRRQNRIFFN